DLARDYVQVHPSTSYTLNRLGDRLPDFVTGWAPRAEAGFLHDLARLELAVLKKGQPVQKLRRRSAWAAIYRSDYTVMRLDLSRAEHDLLLALVSGTP